MACAAPSMTVEAENTDGITSSFLRPSREGPILRDRSRRHSFHSVRKLSVDCDADAVFLKVRSSFRYFILLAYIRILTPDIRRI